LKILINILFKTLLRILLYWFRFYFQANLCPCADSIETLELQPDVLVFSYLRLYY